MKTKVAVIGGGPGGYVAALRAAQLGAQVSLVEQDRIGGVCLNWGCIPTKTLMASAEVLESVHRAESFGVTVDGRVSADMGKMIARKEQVIATQGKGIRTLLAKRGVEVLEGRATITGRGTLQVSGNDGKIHSMAWDKLIIAAGSDVLSIPALPFDGKNIISSTDALALSEIPDRLLIVGGGVIGCEFATLFSRLGSKVSIVEGLDRLLPLPGVDADSSKLLLREMKKRKVEVRLQQTALKAEAGDNGVSVQVGPSRSGHEAPSEVLEADKVLVCIGRRPATRDLGLEQVGVECDAKGWILADESMQAGPDVYAVGDVLGPERVMLAHVASFEGLVAAENVMGGSRRMDYGHVPGAVFTAPEVASAGLSQAQARDAGYEVRTATVLFRPLGKAQASGELAGQAKLVADAADNRLLGVHLVGAHVTELIAQAALALRLGCTAGDVARTIHPHPTLSEIMFEAANALTGQAVHG